MIYYASDNTKITNKNDVLFDIKTKKTSYGRDIDINAFGSMSRIVGIDKLTQQVEKSLFVEKGTYSEAPELGLTINSQLRSAPTISSDIKSSLNSYKTVQKNNDIASSRTVLGKNIYRSEDINNYNYWTKINKNLITSNTYVDDDLTTGSIYYYSITEVYVNSMGETKETAIVDYIKTTINSSSTKNVSIVDDFFIIELANSIQLYWNTPIYMTSEEQLNEILKASVTLPDYEPRSIFVDLVLTNNDVDSIQLLNII